MINARDWLRATLDLVLGLAIAAAVGYLSRSLGSSLDDAIGHGGAILNVGGLGLIAFDLTRARKKFKEPSLFEHLSAAVRSLSRRTGELNVRLEDAIGTASGVSAATAAGTLSPATPEERIAILESAISQLRADHHQRLEGISTDLAAVRGALANEAGARATAVEQLDQSIRDLAIGDLHVAWVGFWWVLCGTIADGFSKPLAALSTAVW